MNYDEAKDETISLLSAVLDKAKAIVVTAFLGHGVVTKAKKIDYACQVLVFTFPDQQPTSDLVDVIGGEVRHLWPDAPPMTATFFKVTSMNSELILDFNWPSGIKALAEQGDIQALFAISGTNSYLPTVRYVLDEQPRQEPGMLTKHERVV
jgi:hypothetical protein